MQSNLLIYAFNALKINPNHLIIIIHKVVNDLNDIRSIFFSILALLHNVTKSMFKFAT